MVALFFDDTHQSLTNLLPMKDRHLKTVHKAHLSIAISILESPIGGSTIIQPYKSLGLRCFTGLQPSYRVQIQVELNRDLHFLHELFFFRFFLGNLRSRVAYDWKRFPEV